MQIFGFNVSESLLGKLLFAFLLFIALKLIKHILVKTIHAIARKKQAKNNRTFFIIRGLNIALYFVFISLFLIASGIGYGDVSLFLSSIFAVLGVALFAQWSILSNVTASFLIFFVFPYRVGDLVKVIDKDEDVTGVIVDITTFHVHIKHEKGHIITYPNNLILQKGVLKLPPKPKASKNPRLYTRIKK